MKYNILNQRKLKRQSYVSSTTRMFAGEPQKPLPSPPKIVEERNLGRDFASAEYNQRMQVSCQCRDELEGVTTGIYWFQSSWPRSVPAVEWSGYDGALGRFTQPDSIVPTGTQGTQAWDRYAFVNNNPVRYNDPTGHGVDCGIGEYCPDPEESCGYYGSETLDCLESEMEDYDNPATYHTEDEEPPLENDPRITIVYGQKLTPEEMKLLSAYGVPVGYYLFLGQLAKSMAAMFYENSPGGDRNAFQHTYWSALLAMKFGASFARQASDGHELLYPNGKKDAFKDAYNNEVGARIGESVRGGSGSTGLLLALVITAVENGNTLNMVNGHLQYSGTSQ